MSEFFNQISNAPPVHQKNRPQNGFSYTFTTSVPSSSSEDLDPLPWLGGTFHTLYTGLGTPLSLPIGATPNLLEITGTITASAPGTLTVGFSSSPSGPINILPFLTQNIPLVMGSNVISNLLASPLISLLEIGYLVFSSDVSITATAVPLSAKIIYGK